MGPNPHEQWAASKIGRDHARDLERPHGREIRPGGRRIALAVLALIAIGVIVWMALAWLAIVPLPGVNAPPA